MLSANIISAAGVSLGPFPDYKSYKSGMGMFMGSVAELWEFADPNSEVSQRYENCLKDVLDYGARITFIGSIDDQLVPLEVRQTMGFQKQKQRRRGMLTNPAHSLRSTHRPTTHISTAPFSSMAGSTPLTS